MCLLRPRPRDVVRRPAWTPALITTQQVAAERDRFLTMLQLLGVVDPDAGEHHAAEEDHKRSRLATSSP